ncbi:MAG TPA: ethanolamine permease [Cyclobacteriaceae bacterium]|nr:ethanolamine permease [Cyclobacteriaceae bacterium]
MTELKRSLTPAMVWGLGVGYVISGNYFGWNLGLEKGGTWGLAIALVFIILMYVTFTLSYSELACSIPKSGGAFDYARKAFGDDVGFIAGMAQNIEFIFAPPAIALGIGAYAGTYFPGVPVVVIAIIAYFIFLILNISGIRIAAVFELVITAIAVVAILVFCTLVFPHFDSANISRDGFPNGWEGVLAATPFAIWFFLGIEGVANLAEETLQPRRTLLIGFGSAITTLVVLCVLTFFSSIGIGGWRSIVFTPSGAISDSPLPMAIQQIPNDASFWYNLITSVGLFGLVASFHGLMLAAGRSTYEFCKSGYGPDFLGRLSARFKTPANALIVNMFIGIAALLSGKTGEVITIAVFGALTIYIVSMLSLIRLRKTHPHMDRPFKVPFYPLFPVIALIISTLSLIAVAVYNLKLAFLYLILLIVALVVYKVVRKPVGKQTDV